MKTGRNEPCPCGSGKKYKHCCISVVGAVVDELSDFLSGQEFESIEELQAAADVLIARQNQEAQDDFLGLSSDQVTRMIYFAFDTPESFKFAEVLSIEPTAPILMLIEGIVSAIDDNGLAATKARGSLPQKLCRELWIDYSQLHADEFSRSFQKVNKEDDFFELNVARILLELAGFLRKTKGRFYLTKKYQKIAHTSGLKGVYPVIFKTYCEKFNWGYGDGYNDAPFIQDSFLFTLYLLNKYGDKIMFTSVYEDAFLQAFPMAVGEMSESSYSTPEKDLQRCYYLRAIKHFLVFFGLAELEEIKGEKYSECKYKIKKAPLFDAVVSFNLVDQQANKAAYSSRHRKHLH